MKKLKGLSIKDTDINSGLEYLPEGVRAFDCRAEERKDAECQIIYNLFANEQGEVEAEEIMLDGTFVSHSYVSCKNFPQKLQEYKQKLQSQQQAQILQSTNPPFGTPGTNK